MNNISSKVENAIMTFSFVWDKLFDNLFTNGILRFIRYTSSTVEFIKKINLVILWSMLAPQTLSRSVRLKFLSDGTGPSNVDLVLEKCMEKLGVNTFLEFNLQPEITNSNKY